MEEGRRREKREGEESTGKERREKGNSPERTTVNIPLNKLRFILSHTFHLHIILFYYQIQSERNVSTMQQFSYFMS